MTMTRTHSTTFPDDIFRCSDEELRRSGFKPTQRFFPGDDLIVYVKPCSKDVAQYLMYRDSRSTGGNVSVSLWLAPVQLPDDRIDVLGIGVKVVLFSEFDVDDSIMKAVTRKAAIVSAKLDGFHELVASELNAPFVENRRTEVYRKSLQIEQSVVIRPSLETRLKETVDSFYEGNIVYDEVKRRCSTLIDEMGDSWCEDLSAIATSQKTRLLAEISIARRLVK